MSSASIGNPHVFMGKGVPTIVFYDKTGTSLSTAFVTPAIEEVDVTVGGASDEQEGVDGDIEHVHFKGEYLEMNLNCRAVGSTVANALKASTLPSGGFTAVITGAKVFRAGDFTDAVNVTSGGNLANRWIVQPGAKFTGPSTDRARINVTLRRYNDIAATSVATE
jgi:hypothetical protein